MHKLINTLINESQELVLGAMVKASVTQRHGTCEEPTPSYHSFCHPAANFHENSTGPSACRPGSCVDREDNTTVFALHVHVLKLTTCKTRRNVHELDIIQNIIPG